MTGLTILMVFADTVNYGELGDTVLKGLGAGIFLSILYAALKCWG